jgi:hydrogenase-4 membrane subunit HyfE
MKLSRLWQPRNPAFWLMVALNLLSTVLAWIARSYELAPAAALTVAAFAIGNALLGLYLMWLLMRDEPANPAGDA